MIINTVSKRIVMRGENGETFTITPDNMGEPYRAGCSFTYESDSRFIHGFFEDSEIERLRDGLNAILDELKN